MTEQQKAVTDVYTGAVDNLPLSVKRDGKDMTIVMQQGREEKSGTKHSLYRHYGTNTGVITADDVVRIPDVLAKGERKPVKRGNTQLYEYTLNENGTTYTVLTEKNNRGAETFADFHTKKRHHQPLVKHAPKRHKQILTMLYLLQRQVIILNLQV